MNREYTKEECRDMLLDKVWEAIDSWKTMATSRDRMEGLAHTILAELDGESGTLPAFIVAPDPHPDDKDYRRERNQNWWPENPKGANCDLGGGLHNAFYSRRPDD